MAWQQLQNPITIGSSFPYGHTILNYLDSAYTAKGWTTTVNTNANASSSYYGSMWCEKNIVMADNTTRRFAFAMAYQNLVGTKEIQLFSYGAGTTPSLDGFGMISGTSFHSYTIADPDLAGTWNYLELSGDSDAFIIFNSDTGKIISFWPPSGTIHDSICTTSNGPDVGVLPLPISATNDMVYIEAESTSKKIGHPFGGLGTTANATTQYTSAMPPSFYNFATVVSEPNGSSFVPYFTDFSGNIGLFSNFTNGDYIGEGGLNTLRVGTTYYVQLGLNNAMLLNYGSTNPGF